MTQQDIRALQTAKSAVRAGVELLMKRLGVSCEEVQEVYLAGASAFSGCESAARIGLFPQGLSGKVRAVGNTSLLGAALYGGRRKAPEMAQELKKKAEVMNLAGEPGFYEKYWKIWNSEKQFNKYIQEKTDHETGHSGAAGRGAGKAPGSCGGKTDGQGGNRGV